MIDGGGALRSIWSKVSCIANHNRFNFFYILVEKKNIVFPKFSVDMNAAAKIYGKSRKPRTAPERTSGAAGTSGFDHNASLARPATRAGTVIVRSDHSSSMGGFLTMDEFLESSKVESRNTLKPGDVRVGDRVCVFINEERCLGKTDGENDCG